MITPEFYEERLRKSKDDPQKAVWEASQLDYDRVKTESVEICHEHVEEGMSVLDAGCGIGELIECLPPGITYLGIDYCKGFIDVARKRYPYYYVSFEVCDLLDLNRFRDYQFDLAICRTVQGVVDRPDGWNRIKVGLLQISCRLLIFRAMMRVGDTLKTVEVLESE